MTACRKVVLTIWLAIGVALIGFDSGCKKKSDPTTSSTNPVHSSGQISASNWEFVTDTEDKEREDLQTTVRDLALKGDFEKLATMASTFRSDKSRFRNGYWKLRSFYIAFGDYDNIGIQYADLIKNLERWVVEQTNSITPRLALVEAYHGYAWVARGSGYASTVTDAGAQTMGERLKKGFDWLNQARELHLPDPALYAVAAHLCLGAELDREVYEKIFNAGLRNAPDYHALYIYKAYYLLPRWYGEQGEWQSFARKMMYQEEIPDHLEVFAEIAIYLRKIGYFYSEFAYNEESWMDLKTSFEAMEKHYPESLETKCIFCRIAANFHDYKVVRDQLKLMDGKADMSVWESQEKLLQAVNWANGDDVTLEAQRKKFIAGDR